MEKPGNLFATVKIGKEPPNENKLRKETASLLKIRSGKVFSSCLGKSTSWFLRKRNFNSKWAILNN